MTKQITPKYALVVDWETSGSTWGGDSSVEHQGLSIGAAVFDTSTFEPVETMYREIKFDASRYKWNIEAQNIHGLTQEYLEQHGCSREDAAIDLATMILKYFGPDPTVMFLGHNCEFDISFTRQLLQPFELMFKIHHVKLDTAGAGFISLGLFKSDLIFDFIGLEKRGEHNALTDALYTLETCKRIRMLVDVALGG